MNRFGLIIRSVLPNKVESFWVRIEQSDIGSRMAKGVFWLFAGTVLSRGLMLVSSIVVANILEKTQYGELGIIQSTVNMFGAFSSLGLGLTATKYVAEFYEKDKAKTGKIIGISTIFAGMSGCIIAIIIIIFAPYLATKAINAPYLVNELRFGAIMLFFSASNGAQNGVLAGFKAFKSITKVNLIAGLISFPLMIGSTLIWGLKGAVIGFGLNFLFLWLLSYRAVRKECLRFNIKIDFLGSLSEWQILYKFSIPALLSGLMVGPVIWGCNAMLVSQPNGYDEMAIFSVAFQWQTVLIFIPGVISQIALPFLSNSSDSQNKFNKILKVSLAINVIISLIMFVLITLFSTLIMSMYGEGFEEGKTVLIILSISAVLISVNGVIGQAIAGKGKMWNGFFINIIWACILLISSFILIKFGFGAKGLAYAFLIAYTFHSIIVSIFTTKYLTKN
jgi:O-antigen/teichoic acid export membrane protein